MCAKPFSWQEPAIEHLKECWKKHPYILAADDTGTGKTYMALFIAKAFDVTPFVIAPKAVHSAWGEAAGDVGVPIAKVINIEKLRTGNTPYLQKLEKEGTFWKWTLPEGMPIIIDEVHKCGGIGTQNAHILLALKRQRIPALMMSATVADNPMRLWAIGYLLGLHTVVNFTNWAKRYGCSRNPYSRKPTALIFYPNSSVSRRKLVELHHIIFPEYGGRLRIAELEDFPENTVLAEAFDLPETEAAEEAEEAFEELENSEEGASDENPLTVSLRARQASELAKMPIFADLTAESLEEGNHVVCFLNFTESLEALGDQLRKKKIEYEVIAGNDKDRDGVIKNFQENKTPVLLVMIQAGGVGISLHDLHGTPRTSLISPPYSTVELKQALGRIHRAGAKSKAVQRIIFAAGTIEESVCRKLKNKLRNLDALLDGPILSTSDFEIKPKRKNQDEG
jgi:hypothetical protein